MVSIVPLELMDISKETTNIDQNYNTIWENLSPFSKKSCRLIKFKNKK